VDDEWVATTVDGVLDVSVLDAARLAPPPALFRGLAGGYLRGLVRRKERLVVFLDVPRLFSTDERIVLEHPAAEPVRNG
jgi:purine-binding chemotaxis protein CheW